MNASPWRRALLLVLITALFVFWWGGRRSAPLTEPANNAALTETTTTPAAAAPVATARAKKLSGGFHARAEEAGDENVIPFRVEDGVAIAFGDVIIGEPEDSQLTEGFFEVPTPNLWDRPEIPYAISKDLPNPERVKGALDYFNQNTPVTFVPYDGQASDAVVFEPTRENCYSLLGKQGGLQPVRLAADCGQGEILHELMHVLGFVHEQSRRDRDSYVEILWPNIEEKFRDQFAMVPDSLMQAQRQGSFDYESILLYPPTIFARHGQLTMRSRTGTAIQPVTQSLSAGDHLKLRELYRPYVK